MSATKTYLATIACLVVLLAGVGAQASGGFPVHTFGTDKAGSAQTAAPATTPASAPLVTHAPSDTATGECANATNDNTFNSDFTVSFSPYQINLAGQTPIVNVSQFTTREAITVSVTSGAQAAGVTMIQVLLTVWSTWWNSTNSSTSPNAPPIWDLPISNGTQATGILIDEKYFPPGSTVYFNLTITASPSYSEIYSPCPVGPDPVSSQVKAQPTWMYIVAGGWPSPGFLSDISLTAFPNIFEGVFPDPFQKVHITMNSVGGSTVPIGGANIYYNITYTDLVTGNSTTQGGGGQFSPANSTSTSVNVGPYYSAGNQTTVQFYILAWETWSGGAVNEIKSPSYSYKVTNGGTFCNPNESFAHYVTVTTSINGDSYSNITSQNNTLIPAFEIVNVSAESVSPNTTIAYGILYFNETYQGKRSAGYLPTYEYNSTTQYTGSGFSNPFLPVLGPFEPGVNVSFNVVVFDSLHCSLASPTWSFHTARGPPPIVDGKTFFYVVAYDVGLGSYAVGARVEFNNATWYDNTTTNRLGFAYPNITDSIEAAYLNMNQYYNVTVTYEGQTQHVTYLLNAASNKTLTFYFDTGKTTVIIYSLSNPPFNFAIVGGLIAATAILLPIYYVWTEIRKKAEAEEKRITL